MTTKSRDSKPEGAQASEVDSQISRPSDMPASGVHRTEKPRRAQGWTVTERFVSEGYVYRLMRRPVEPSDAGPHFTRREEEALALACDGCSNKRIAQVLDVSPSTVGVLLFRAALKLNVKSRDDLVAAYKRLIAASPNR